MKRLQMPQKLVYEKFYVHEIAVVKLSKIYFLKNAKKNVNQTTTIYIAIELDKNFEKKLFFLLLIFQCNIEKVFSFSLRFLCSSWGI